MRDYLPIRELAAMALPSGQRASPLAEAVTGSC